MDLEPMSRASVLLPFSFRKFLLIQLRMSSRQVMREVGGMAAVGLVTEVCPGGEGQEGDPRLTPGALPMKHPNTQTCGSLVTRIVGGQLDMM